MCFKRSNLSSIVPQKNQGRQVGHFFSGDKGCQEEKEINSQLREDSAAATEELLIRAKLSGNFP